MGLSIPPIRHSQGQIRPYVDVQQLQDQIMTTQEWLRQANKTYARYYNQHQTDIMFVEGDLVLVNGKNVSVDKQTKKLHWKKLGPFKIQRVISQLLYKLDILADQNIYNVFNVALLEPFQGEQQVSPTLAGKDLLPNRDDKWEVEAVVDSRVHDGRLQYLVKWKPTDQVWDNTWEPTHFARNAKAKVQRFHVKNPKKPRAGVRGAVQRGRGRRV